MEDEDDYDELEQIDNVAVVSKDNNNNNNTKQQLEELNEYVEQMAYKPVDPQPASKRTEDLAKVPKKRIIGTYADHKDNLKPKERSERVGRIVQGHTPMTVENLEEFIRTYRKKQAHHQKLQKQQQITYHETLIKLQKQCENQLMNAIVSNFAKFVAKKASSIMPESNVVTESYQRLQNSLICNMMLTLKLPNEHQARDLTVYKKLAAVLSDLILEVLFLANNSDYYQNAEGDHGQQPPQITEKDLVLKFRALRAAKKKLYNSRAKSSRGKAILSHHLNK